MTNLSQLDRLRLIIKVLRECNEPVTPERVGWLYRYETGEDMDPAGYERALK